MRKIVVIDDDEMVGQVTSALLKIRGYDVYVANSGAVGVELVHREMPDIVLCDMRMPVMGGEQVLTALKGHPNTRHIPVVFMTGQCNVEFIGKGDGFIWKPFSADELVAILERLIVSTAAAVIAPVSVTPLPPSPFR